MPQQRNTVIVVNEQDEWLGTMEKLAAHQEGVLHRAISVFVFNDRGELLLQQRAEGKYHSAGQWSNTCCSHPMPGESSLSAAHRRLKEEMGFETTLVPLFDLRYKANVGHGLIENEFDHIFIGCYNAPPAPDPSEVRAAQYLDSAAILRWMEREPEAFTSWFHLAFSKVLMHLEQQAAA